MAFLPPSNHLHQVGTLLRCAPPFALCHELVEESAEGVNAQRCWECHLFLVAHFGQKAFEVADQIVIIQGCAALLKLGN
jgi:citrate lyase synthetase